MSTRTLSAEHLAAMLAGKAASDEAARDRRDREAVLRREWSAQDAALTGQIMATEREHGAGSTDELRAQRIAAVHALHSAIGALDAA